MKNQGIELKIRGLSKDEVTYLKALAEKKGSPSFNQFLLEMCREKIEHGKFNRSENIYLDHLEGMKETADFMKQQTEKHANQMEDFSKKMDKYADHISRWLEYEGEVERDD